MSAYLNGLSAIVTGAGKGIGFEICRQLSEQGVSVLLNDIENNLANEAAAKIVAEGGTCIAHCGDSSSLQCIDAMISACIKHFGKLDIIIANAGITLFGDFLEYSPEHFSMVMNTNLGGSFFLAQRAARQFISQHSGGSILFMSSVTGHQAHKDLAAYGMSKAALEMLAKNLVIELSPFNINVNTIAPGATITERTTNDPEYINVWSKLTPMGRPATVEDIANAALFLISPLSRHITGQSLVIDGGWSAISPGP